MPHQRPELPTAQRITVPQVEERIQVIVGHPVLDPALAIDREQDEEDFVPEKSVLQTAIHWKERRVIVAGNGRTLLEINGKQREPAAVLFLLILAAGETEDLDHVPPIFHSESAVGDQRIGQIDFVKIRDRIPRAR